MAEGEPLQPAKSLWKTSGPWPLGFWLTDFCNKIGQKRSSSAPLDSLFQCSLDRDKL
jgi:hypothetical protein